MSPDTRGMRAVTSFILSNGRILLLRRSPHMKSMPGMWAAVSGVVEGSEEVMVRALTEIYEETGMSHVRPVLSCMPVAIPRHDIVVHPFLFWTCNHHVRLNWENDMYAWVRPVDIKQYKTVPYLEEMLWCLLGGIGALAGQHYIDAGAAAHRTGNVVPRMLAGTGVNLGGLLGVYG